MKTKLMTVTIALALCATPLFAGGHRGLSYGKPRSSAAKHEFMRETGYPHGRSGYVVDHIIALKRGGADTPQNMQWQTKADALAKDKVE